MAATEFVGGPRDGQRTDKNDLYLLGTGKTVKGRTLDALLRGDLGFIRKGFYTLDGGKYLWTAVDAVAAKARVCQHPLGCLEFVEGRKDYCKLHNDRLKRTGALGPVGLKIAKQVKTEDGLCIDPRGCQTGPDGTKGRVVRGGLGWCSAHSQRIRKYGDPGPVGLLIARPYKDTICQYLQEDCSETKIYAYGLCNKHWQRAKNAGQLGLYKEYTEDFLPALCAHPLGCPRFALNTGQKDHKGNGWGIYCQMHYGRMLATGELGPVRTYTIQPGERRIDEDGYAWSHDASGMVRAEHIWKMEEHLGRKLQHGQTVHHKDNRDRSHNCIDNLQLRQGQHGPGAVFQCVDCESYNIIAVPLADTTEHVCELTKR